MIDTDKYERTTPELTEFEGENLGDLITNLLTEVKRLRLMADELIAIWEILDEDYPQVDRAIVKELIERKIGDYEVIE